MQIKELERKINDYIKDNHLLELKKGSWGLRDTMKEVILNVFNIKDELGQDYELYSYYENTIRLANKNLGYWEQPIIEFKFKRKKQPGYSTWGIKSVNIISGWNNTNEYKQEIEQKIREEKIKKEEKMRQQLERVNVLSAKYHLSIETLFNIYNDISLLPWDTRASLREKIEKEKICQGEVGE